MKAVMRIWENLRMNYGGPIPAKLLDNGKKHSAYSKNKPKKQNSKEKKKK